MRIIGLGLVMAGWCVAVGGLFITASNSGRALIATVGILLSLLGSLGVLNTYYLAHANWKK